MKITNSMRGPGARIFVAVVVVLLWFARASLDRRPVGTAQGETRRADSNPNTRSGIDSAAQAIDAFANQQLRDHNLPAISISFADDQKILGGMAINNGNLSSAKPVTQDTVYRVGSVSKLFTDIAIMQLVEKGKVDLDVPITTYLPDFHPRNPFGGHITLRSLMCHRSGLVREPPIGNYFDPSGPTLAQTIDSLNSTELIYAPGTHTKYSNAAIATVGYVLERISGQPFADYLKHAVLEPMGLNHSSFEPTAEIEKSLANGYMWTIDGRTFPAPTFQLGISPAGCMYTTTNDLAQFVKIMLNGGSGPGGQVIKPSTLEEMWTPQLTSPGQKGGFGIGFHIRDLDGHRMVGHDGAIYGFATSLAILPEQKLGVAVVATEDCANSVTDRIADYALRALLAARAGKPIPSPEETTAIPPSRARQLAGRYRHDDHYFDLIESNGRLSLFDSNGGYQVELRQAADSLIVDDRLAFGKTFRVGGDALISGDDVFKRVQVPKPDPCPPELRSLIGEYGWDHDILYITERDGKLWALIEWFEFDPLEQESESVFRFPKHGLYDGEKLVFARDKAGRATAVIAAGVKFKRRAIGPEEGEAQLKVKPLRPVPALLKEARTAAPPPEPGKFRATDLVELTKLDPTIKLDIRYATTNNLFGTVFYAEPRAFMQRDAAEAVVKVNRRLRPLGYGLLVHDAYRPWFVTKVFWDATPDDKKIFVANPAQGSRHNRGCAVDLTLYDLMTGQPIEMAGTYDETTDRSYPDYPGGTSLQRWHRRLLRDAMESQGFTVYEAEWWHFDYKDWKEYRIGNVAFDQVR